MLFLGVHCCMSKGKNWSSKMGLVAPNNNYVGAKQRTMQPTAEGLGRLLRRKVTKACYCYTSVAFWPKWPGPCMAFFPKPITTPEKSGNWGVSKHFLLSPI